MITIKKRTLVVGLVVVVLMLSSAFLYTQFSNRMYMRLSNNSGHDIESVSYVIHQRYEDATNLGSLKKGESRWVSLECKGYAAYSLLFKLQSGELHETEGRYVLEGAFIEEEITVPESSLQMIYSGLMNP